MSELGDVLEKIGELRGIVKGFDQRFSSLEEKLDRVDKKCDDLQDDVSKLRVAFSGIKMKMAGLSSIVGAAASFALVFAKDAISYWLNR